MQRQQPERPARHPLPAGVGQLTGQRERVLGVLASLIPAAGLGQALGTQHLGPRQERIPPFAARRLDAQGRKERGDQEEACSAAQLDSLRKSRF